MKRGRGLVLFTVLVTFGFLSSLGADVPERREEFIYSIVAFQGDEYTGTFSREDSEKIYFLADRDNFLIGQNTFVYFWPITGEWRTDVQTFQHMHEGTLKISGKNIETIILKKQNYTYYVIKGEYKNELIIATGDEAVAVKEKYQQSIRDYYNAMSEYNKAQLRHKDKTMEMADLIIKKREKGEDVSDLQNELKELPPPVQPERPQQYVVPPGEVRPAFIINLPPGEYSIRHLSPEGKVFEQSDKTLVIFEANRSRGIGYEIIPGDKWTRPEESKTPSSVVYVNGSTDLYVRPFYEREYNDHYYKRLLDNNDSGNPNLMTWQRGAQIPQATIHARNTLTFNKTQDIEITEKPYYVEQAKGAALGYTIVPFDPEGAHKDKDPSLKAFHIPMNPELKKVILKTENYEGDLLKGSSRQIRVIKGETDNILLLILSFVPLLAMALVFLVRKMKRG
jgi:hypothetical protein